MGHPMVSGHGAAEEPPIAAPIADATLEEATYFKLLK